MSDRIAVMDGGRVQQLADPKTLYEQPQTSFVADFIGTSNALDGQRRPARGRARDRRAGAGRPHRRPADCAIGDSLQVSIRPEKISISPATTIPTTATTAPGCRAWRSSGSTSARSRRPSSSCPPGNGSSSTSSTTTTSRRSSPAIRSPCCGRHGTASSSPRISGRRRERRDDAGDGDRPRRRPARRRLRRGSSAEGVVPAPADPEAPATGTLSVFAYQDTITDELLDPFREANPDLELKTAELRVERGGGGEARRRLRGRRRRGLPRRDERR